MAALNVGDAEVRNDDRLDWPALLIDCGTANDFADLTQSRPGPVLRKFRQDRSVECFRGAAGSRPLGFFGGALFGDVGEKVVPILGSLVCRAPVLRQFSGDGSFQQRATESAKPLARLRQRCLTLRDLGEQRIHPRHDAALFGERCKREVGLAQPIDRHAQLPS